MPLIVSHKRLIAQIAKYWMIHKCQPISSTNDWAGGNNVQRESSWAQSESRARLDGIAPKMFSLTELGHETSQRVFLLKLVSIPRLVLSILPLDYGFSASVRPGSSLQQQKSDETPQKSPVSTCISFLFTPKSLRDWIINGAKVESILEICDSQKSANKLFKAGPGTPPCLLLEWHHSVRVALSNSCWEPFYFADSIY